jgi:DNA/RNA-binding domain of Phe-tRNA-synthetase-like protein
MLTSLLVGRYPSGMPFLPIIDPGVAAVAPGFRALSLFAEAAGEPDPAVSGRALEEASAAVLRGEPVWAEAHLAAWAEVFRRFGAKPQRTPCSAEALRRRVLRDGGLPLLDPVVDLYNAISLRYALPVGGENAAAYVGRPRLTIAVGDEVFDTVRDGQAAEEHPDQGEVVWRDDQGVTCRRWNWRQGVRTRLGAGATRLWFILESLPPMPLEALHQAGEELAAGLRAMYAEIEVETTFVEI